MRELPSNLPRQELLERAEAAIQMFATQGVKAHVNFKFTCERCGERCTLTEPNMLYENGECHVCGHVTKIVEGGFALTANLGMV
jgi:rRNA maturation endonuclease Nob1